MATGAGRRDELLEMRGHTEQRRSRACGCRVATSQFSNGLQQTEPWLSGCPVLSGVICRAVGQLSDQLSGVVSAVGCCRMLSGAVGCCRVDVQAMLNGRQRKGLEKEGSGTVRRGRGGERRQHPRARRRRRLRAPARTSSERLRAKQTPAGDAVAVPQRSRLQQRRRRQRQQLRQQVLARGQAVPVKGPRRFLEGS